MFPPSGGRRRPIDLSGLDLEPEPAAPSSFDPSLLEGLDLDREFSPVATALRVLPGVAGSYLGGMVGMAGGPAAPATVPGGAVLGGALGSGVGEFLAQLYEGRASEEEGLNKTQIGLQTAIGAIPGVGPIRNLKGFAGLLARTGTNAATGAVIGGVTAPVVEEVEREGLEGLDLTDLEPGVVDKMIQGAKWGGAFGAGGGLAMEGIGQYLSRRAARRAGTVDSGYDPNFEARYEKPPARLSRQPQPAAGADPNFNGGAGDPMQAGATPYPMGPQPIPGEVQSPIPPPFSAPAPLPLAPEPLLPRPKRSYADDADLLATLESAPAAAEQPALPRQPALPPDVQRELLDLGINPELVDTLTMQDADEIFANLRPQYDPETQGLFDEALTARQAIESDVDPQQFRDEFEFALEQFRDRSQPSTEGLSPRDLMRAIAERGGLNMPDDFAGDQWNRVRRPNAELQRIKDLAKGAGYTDSGRFGTALGVRGVFRRAGQPLDVMLQDLASDPRFARVETTNDLLEMLEQAFIQDARTPAVRTKPTVRDLRLPDSMEALARRRGDAPNPLDEVAALIEREETAGGPIRMFDAAAELKAIRAQDIEQTIDRRKVDRGVPDTEVGRRLEDMRDAPPTAEELEIMARETMPAVEDWTRPVKSREPRPDVPGATPDVIEDLATPQRPVDINEERRIRDVAEKVRARAESMEFEDEVLRLREEGWQEDAASFREAGLPPTAEQRRAAFRDVSLPGTEDVRAIENATPEVAEAPFSLEPPKRGQAIEQQARGAREVDAQAELDDFFSNPERGGVRPQLAGALGGAAVGAAGGTAAIEEDDTTLEKIGKVAGGALVGAGAGGAVGGRMGSSPTVRPGGSRPPASTPTAAAADATITTPRGEQVRLPKYAGNINLERLETTDSVKATIDTIARELRPQLENARRGRIAQDVTRQMAAELGMTEAELLARRRGQAFNAEQALAAREINASSARRLTDAAAAARSSPTPENYSRLMLALQQQVAIQEQIAGATAEAGRSLAQFRMMANDTLTLPELNDLILSAGGTESLDAIATRLMQLDPTNIRAVNQFARDVKKATVTDKVYEAWMNALLSGPVTHVANTISNGLTAMTHPVEKGMAGVLDLLRAKAGGSPQERFAREGAYALVGLWKGLSGGVRAGLQAAITDTPQFGIGRVESSPGGKIGGTAGHIIRTPTKALLFEDEFFKNIVYSADLHARAVRQALREGSNGKQVGLRVAEILQNPTIELKSAGQKEALYRTFNTPLTARWERSIMELRNAVPGARWIIPFLRTPINVAKFGLERTPLHLGDLMAKIAAGKLSIQDLEEEAAKVAIGATMAMGVAAAYQNGMITGGGSPDRSKHATQAVKRPDYSVKVGDQWFSYQRLEPLGISMGLTADFMETLETGKQDAAQLPAKLLYSFSKNLQSKTFLQGMTDFFNVLSDYPRYGDEWINRMAGSVVPTAVAQVSRASDPIVRKPRSATEAIMNRTGQGENLTPMLDVFGRPITSDMTPMERLVSPVQRRKANQDPLIDELERLGVTLSVPSERLTVKDHELSTNDKSTLAQARGQGVKRELDQLLQSGSFQRADDDDRRERVERAINQARDAVSRRARMLVRRNEPLTIEELLGMDPAQ